MSAIDPPPAEPVALLALTALQRESVRVWLDLLPDLRAKFASAEPDKHRIALSSAELEEFRRRLAAILPYSIQPHTRRFEAIARRVDRVLQPLRGQLRAIAAANAPPPRPQAGLVFQFKVTLRGIDPPIWRRFLVEDIDLKTLHHVVLTVMGWTHDVEPHLFEIDGVQYGPRVHDGTTVDRPLVDEADVLLSALFPRACPPATVRYEYDFTAGWQHDLDFEGHRAWDFDVDYPKCLEGERECPPEGAWGLEEYRRFLAGSSRYAERILANVPRDRRPFHPESFNPRKATAMLKEIPVQPARMMETRTACPMGCDFR